MNKVNFLYWAHIREEILHQAPLVLLTDIQYQMSVLMDDQIDEVEIAIRTAINRDCG